MSDRGRPGRQVNVPRRDTGSANRSHVSHLLSDQSHGFGAPPRPSSIAETTSSHPSSERSQGAEDRSSESRNRSNESNAPRGRSQSAGLSSKEGGQSPQSTMGPIDGVGGGTGGSRPQGSEGRSGSRSGSESGSGNGSRRSSTGRTQGAGSTPRIASFSSEDAREPEGRSGSRGRSSGAESRSQGSDDRSQSPRGRSEVSSIRSGVSSWTDKDERQFDHISKSSRQRGMSADRAEEMAARTVNKNRRLEGRTASRTTQGTGNPTARLEQRTKQELYNRAKQMHIHGRSDMTKAELIDAIRAKRG